MLVVPLEGEAPERIFETGCPSYDRLFSQNASGWQTFELDAFFSNSPFPIKPYSYIICLMHPITNNPQESQEVFDTLLHDMFYARRPTVMFYPNIDPGNKALIQSLHNYQKQDAEWAKWLRLVTHVSLKGS